MCYPKSKRNSPGLPGSLLLGCCLLILCVQGLAQSEQALDQAFLRLSQASLLARAEALQAETTRFKKIEALRRTVEQLDRRGQTVDALATLVANANLIYQHIDHELTPDLTWYLYSHNIKTSADAIVDYASKRADPYRLAKIQLQQAKYYFITGNWENALATLEGVDAYSALSDQDASYSYLIQGIALQRMKKHREAMQHYKKVEKESEYYSVALLNHALANIRQGWWTDAHILLEKAIEIELKKGNTSLIERLYLTLGFSLLQNEFYRDARERFRAIGVDSPYVNRAMLGLAIAAMHQEDFIGALNMLKKLKQKQGDDPSIHESRLLLPYVYEEIDQLRLAAANYNQAEKYFQQLAAELTNRRLEVNAEFVLELSRNITPSLLEFTQSQPATVSIDPLARLNIRLLDKLSELESDKKRLADLRKLQQTYIDSAIASIKKQFEDKKAVVESYLSQTRFALANLYDK